MAISGPMCDSPTDVVVEIRAQVARLAETMWVARTARERLEVFVELERLRATLAAVSLELAVQIDTAEDPKTQAWSSSADYLTATTAGRVGKGQRMLRTGRALTSERQLTRAALLDGTISPEQADAIVGVLARFTIDEDLCTRAEKVLLAEAAHLNATELQIAGEHLWEILDPDGHAAAAERALRRHERSAHLNRFLSIVDDGLGGVTIKGRGTLEDAAVLRAALDALCAPNPDHAEADAVVGSGVDAGGGAAGAGAGGARPCGDPGRDRREAGARRWDALVALAQKAVDAQVLPTDHGRKPQVTVFIDFDDLRNEVGTGTLETGEHLSAAAVRKLACDADILPVVLNGEGVPLDVGRAHRLVTPAIWTAVVARDRHCRFPGCTRPPIACDAHHIVHWADGGPTSLDGLVLLCRRHHTTIHETGWQVRLNAVDRRPEFKPPGTGRFAKIHAPDADFDEDGWIRRRTPRG